MANNDSKKAIFSEINITPLTDIFLVLLIIMMVVAPTFQSVDSSISVPEINSGIAIEQKDATVAITADGKYYLNNAEISPNNLYDELEKLKPNLEKKEVVVKADASVKSTLVMEVMRAAEAADYDKLTIAGEPMSKKDARMLEELNAQENQQVEQQEEPVNEQSTKQPIGALPGD